MNYERLWTNCNFYDNLSALRCHLKTIENIQLIQNFSLGKSPTVYPSPEDMGARYKICYYIFSL